MNESSRIASLENQEQLAYSCSQAAHKDDLDAHDITKMRNHIAEPFNKKRKAVLAQLVVVGADNEKE